VTDYNTSKVKSSSILLTILYVLFAFFVLWWILLHSTPLFAEDQLADFADTYAFVALFGGLLGIYLAGKWGGFSSILGKIVLFFSLGLLAQVFGQFSYAFYARVLGVEIPYPSVGDIGFFGSIPLYIIGAYYLVKLTSVPVKNGQPTKLNPIAIAIPIFMLLLSYLVFLRGYEVDPENNLATILDFGYPLAQSIYVSLGLIAFYYTKNMTNSLMHKKIIFLLSALVFQYVSDFVFLYKASNDMYVTGGITDLLYLISYFLMTLAIINLNDVFDRVRNGSVTK